jgi:hypothetical protein
VVITADQAGRKLALNHGKRTVRRGCGGLSRSTHFLLESELRCHERGAVGGYRLSTAAAGDVAGRSMVVGRVAMGILGFEMPFYLERAHVHTVQRGQLSTRQTLSTQDETEGEFTLQLGSLVVMFIAVGGMTVGIRRHYRCPRCEEIPMGSGANLGPSSFGWRSGVALLPSVCPNCGARLR